MHKPLLEGAENTACTCMILFPIGHKLFEKHSNVRNQNQFKLHSSYFIIDTCGHNIEAIK